MSDQSEGTSSDGTSVLKFNAAHFAMLAEMQNAKRVLPFTLVPVGVAYSNEEDNSPVDVGWFDDMTFAPRLWSLMKRGGIVCHIFYGKVVDTGGRDRAAETEARVRSLLQAAR